MDDQMLQKWAVNFWGAENEKCLFVVVKILIGSSFQDMCLLICLWWTELEIDAILPMIASPSNTCHFLATRFDTDELGK